MKRYVTPRTGRVWGTSSKEDKHEENTLKQACQQIRHAGTISDELKLSMVKSFDKKFDEAMKLVDQGRVRQVSFTPSGRTVWVVKGRKKDYQVVPQSMFCTCDDYYFRVMGHKKQLCYHLIAQHLAEALGMHGRTDLVDSEYAGFTEKWKPKVDSG